MAPEGCLFQKKFPEINISDKTNVSKKSIFGKPNFRKIGDIIFVAMVY